MSRKRNGPMSLDIIPLINTRNMYMFTSNSLTQQTSIDVVWNYIGKQSMIFACLYTYMGLEDQIKQSKFASEQEKAIVNISFTQSYFSGLFNAALKEHKVSLQQFNVMRILKGQHPKAVSVNEINSRMVDKMSNCSRLVEKLHAKDLVERTTCSYDKRQLDISLTSEGIKVLKQLNSLVNGVISQHDNLTGDEFKTLNLLLEKLRGE